MGRAFAAALVIALCIWPARAAADTVPESQWRAEARALAAPWPKIQRPTGNLPDYLDGLVGTGEEGTRYGDSLTGYGLLQTGLREHDDEAIAAGIRAVDYATSDQRAWPTPSVFETMAVAGSYNLARVQLAADPRFAASRAQWERWLRRVRTVRLHYVNRYGNHWLVDAISVLELERSGIRSNRGGTVLGTGRTTAVREAVRLINTRVPKMVPDSGPFVLSDPPDNPLAYQALSLALYARAIDLLGNRAGPAARQTLRRVVRASVLVAAPDGDLAYFGRSQGEIWALPATAYGAEVAASQPGSGDADDALDHALAARAIKRLADAYPVGDRGPWITPALADDLQAGARGLDAYAGAPSMGGLALVTLNWAIDRAPEDAVAGELPADHLYAARVSQDRGQFAVVRRGDTWYAVKMTGTTDVHHRGDLRYDFGLVAAKRQVGGNWVDLVPERPLTHEPGVASAGPVLLGGGPAYPFGDSIRVDSQGTVRIKGGYRTVARKVVRRGTFVYRPLACGVELVFRGQVGDVFSIAPVFTGKDAPVVTGARVSGGGQEVGFDPQAYFAPGGVDLASSAHAWMKQVPILVYATSSRQIRVSYCAPAADTGTSEP
jgi:hypothetical protein